MCVCVYVRPQVATKLCNYLMLDAAAGGLAGRAGWQAAAADAIILNWFFYHQNHSLHYAIYLSRSLWLSRTTHAADRKWDRKSEPDGQPALAIAAASGSGGGGGVGCKFGIRVVARVTVALRQE